MRRRLVIATTIFVIVQMVIAGSVGFLSPKSGNDMQGMKGMSPGVPMVMEHLITPAQRQAAAARAAAARRAHGASVLSDVAALAQTAVAPSVANAQTAPADPKIPDYFGTSPNYANSPLPPNVVITGGGGKDAEAIATVQTIVGPGGVITRGVVTAIKVTNPGTGYTPNSTFPVTIDPTISTLTDNNNNPIVGDGTGATAEATVDATGHITAITVTNGGQDYGGIRKFVDSLPGLTAAGANNLGQYIQIAVADTTSYPGSDYYEIGLVEYEQQFHSDLPASKLRGYVQLNDPTTKYQVTRDASGKITGWPQPHYLGPTIIANRDVPVRIKFINLLPTGTGGDLFIPMDPTVMGAGDGPIQATNTNGTPAVDAAGHPIYEQYTQNRATLHLHGGLTPWISDGTPHQWTTPAGENTVYPKGVSTQDVPDMPPSAPGEMTFFYSNQQSARLMFYHDHSYGITRLNVYAGEAAGYLLTDTYEKTLVAGGTVPGPNGTTVNVPAETVPSNQIPLIIQDKTFVPGPKQLEVQDPTWNHIWRATTTGPILGGLWLPHVYMPNQNPVDLSGTNAMGRWDYSQWFWPPTAPAHGTVANPFYDPNTSEGPDIPGINNPSLTPEAFMDTPVVNGVAYPYVKLKQQVYRFRILNAANDRSLNLQLYYAKSNGDLWDAQGNLNDPGAGEVDMVNAWGKPLPMGVVPPWPNDNRMGGVPNQNSVGPSFIQIGTEGGFLPAPVVLNNRPVGYENNLRNIVVTNINTHTLMLAPAERADVIVDFSKIPAGSKLILYNDSPAPVPAFDPRYDYYTGDLDQTDSGGAPTTLAGYGPNTRTIMQIQISGDNANVDSVYPNNNYKTYDKDAARMSNLKTALQATFAASQDPIIVPEPDYNGAYGKTFAAVVSRIQNTSLTFTPNSVGATPITIGMKPKAIQELFELQYGRMNATMGVEIPNTTGVNQTTIPLGYVDPSTENIDDSMTATAPTLTDGTQIWKVTHNGVDTHAIHFHLFNVQIINRVGWDGQVRLPEANEIGWKDTVRMNPLEDAIVALRPIAAKSPFGTYQSVRPLDVTAPLGSRMNFWPQDPLGNPVQTVNKLYNFGDEYVWHCHLLGHEENDMMRPIVFNTSRIAPPVPTSVAAANLLSGAVKLDWIDATLPTPGYGVTGNSWGNPTGEIGYIILRQDNGTGNFIEIGRASANATTFTDSTVASGSYSYKVVAFNGASASADSNISLSASDPVAITVAGTVVAPSAPTNLAASFLAPPLGVNLTWTAATGHVDSYTVTRNDNKTWTNIGTTSFTDSSVAANTSYSYTVTAVNTAGNATSDSLAVLTLPDAPTGLGATTSPTDVTLNWTAPAGTISGYTIERSTDKVSFQTIATTLTATPSYIDNNVLSNASYFYRVKANNTTGESAATPWLFVTVKANLPDAPTGLTPILAPAAPTQVNLTWAAGSAIPVTSYLIERSPDGTTGSWTQVGSADTTSFIDTGVTANTSYYYHIIATNSAYSPSYGPASISADLQVVTLPNAATALIGTLNRTGGADLSWVAPIGGATSYTVQRNDGVSGWADVMSVTAIAPATIPDTTYSDASVVANTTYSYRILANNSTPAAGLASNEVTVVVPPALPNVATSLTATATATGVNLSWTAPTSVVSSYRIERRNSVSAVNVQAGLWGAVGTSNTPAFTDNTTASNISYDYQVIAINAAGDAPASAFASALTLPDAVTGLSFEANTTGVALKWTAVAGNGTVTYTVERQDGATWKLVGSTQGTTATDTDTLAGNTSYTYRVTASNATGNGPSLTITALTVPDAPTNLNGALNTSGAILTWTAPSGAISSYTIERSADNGGTWDILSDTLTGTSYTDSTNGTASNTTYSYRVSAKNSSGLGAASATFNLLSLPGVATNLTAKQVGAVINLAWTAPAGKIIGYLVQRSTDDGATWTVVNGALTPAPAFTDTPVAGNTNYSYSVTAYNATGAGQASSVAKVLTIPAAPTVSAAVQFGPQVALTLTSTGNEPSPGYTIQRRTSAIPATGGRRAVPAGAWATITPSTPYIDTTVVANTSYDYQATATNTSGTGPNSTPTTIAVPALPTAPTNLAARAPAGINVVLTWRNSTTNQTNVIIERTAAGGTLLFTEIGRVAGTVTTFTDTPPTPLSSYVYRVRAINIAGSSPVSNQVTFIAPFPAPSGLAAPAASITTNSITLNWTSNTPNATGFVVERSPNGNTWTTVGTVAQTTATTYSFTNTGLTTRTTYRYRVRAFFNPLGGTTYVAGTSLVSANTATLQVRTP